MELEIWCEIKRMRLIGIEPTHAAPEATALSTELQVHKIKKAYCFSSIPH